MTHTEICKACNGSGKDPVLPLKCSNCTGRGVVKKIYTLEKEQPKTTIGAIDAKDLAKMMQQDEKLGLYDEQIKPKSKHKYTLKTYNGRVKIYCDDYVMFAFNQIDFSGYYAYKDDTNLYGIDIYMNRQGAGHQIMEIYFKTKENWLEVLKILDTI